MILGFKFRNGYGRRVNRPTREVEGVRTPAANYRIRVVGVLGDEWSERAHGLTVSVRRSETEGIFTELVGELADRAALMGVLDTLYTHGASLLSVERVGKDGATIVEQGLSP